MTKKKLWIAILVAFVVLASSVIYLSRAAIFQRGNPIPYEAKPVFKTENISRITFYKLPDTGKEYEVPSEYVGEITEWLGTFVAGKKADEVLPPGADSLFIKIEYSDGTVIESSMSTTIIDGVTYLINCDKEPECYFEIFSASPTEEELRLRFPEYYNLITPKGLEVYVWQTADSVFYCGLLPGTNRGATEDEITSLAANGATVEEMKMILSSYDVPYEEGIFIKPCIQPTSDYTYQIDDTYIQKVNALFDK